jgi:hypothetical protein
MVGTRNLNANSNTTTADQPQQMYVQLRPGAQLFNKCIAHLERTVSQHPDVDVQIAGYAREDHQYLLTLSVNLGPRDQIAKFSPEAVAGYNFVAAVFTDMFDFLPQYTQEPSAIERANAEHISGLTAAVAADANEAPRRAIAH